jgi:hypothetical protein
VLAGRFRETGVMAMQMLNLGDSPDFFLFAAVDFVLTRSEKEAKCTKKRHSQTKEGSSQSNCTSLCRLFGRLSQF